MKNFKPQTIEFPQHYNNQTGVKSTQFKVQLSTNNFETPMSNNLGKSFQQLQKKQSGASCKASNSTYISIQNKLRKNSLDYRQSSKSNEQVTNNSFDFGHRTNQKTFYQQKPPNKSQNTTLQRQSGIFTNIDNEYISLHSEIKSLRIENDDLRAQLKELYKLDEQHKDIQKLLRQQFEFQQQFYEKEMKKLQNQLTQKMQQQIKEPSLILQNFFTIQTHNLALILQDLKLPKTTNQKLLNQISFWLENLFQQITNLELNKQKSQSKQRFIVKSPNTQQSDNDSMIDVQQLINFNEDSDILNWDSPEISQSKLNLPQTKQFSNPPRSESENSQFSVTIAQFIKNAKDKLGETNKENQIQNEPYGLDSY